MIDESIRHNLSFASNDGIEVNKKSTLLLVNLKYGPVDKVPLLDLNKEEKVQH